MSIPKEKLIIILSGIFGVILHAFFYINGSYINLFYLLISLLVSGVVIFLSWIVSSYITSIQKDYSLISKTIYATIICFMFLVVYNMFVDISYFYQTLYWNILDACLLIPIPSVLVYYGVSYIKPLNKIIQNKGVI